MLSNLNEKNKINIKPTVHYDIIIKYNEPSPQHTKHTIRLHMIMKAEAFINIFGT